MDMLSLEPKYGFSLDRNVVLKGEEKSKLSYVTPSCVQNNVKMQVQVLMVNCKPSTESTKKNSQSNRAKVRAASEQK